MLIHAGGNVTVEVRQQDTPTAKPHDTDWRRGRTHADFSLMPLVQLLGGTYVRHDVTDDVHHHQRGRRVVDVSVTAGHCGTEFDVELLMTRCS